MGISLPLWKAACVGPEKVLYTKQKSGNYHLLALVLLLKFTEQVWSLFLVLTLAMFFRIFSRLNKSKIFHSRLGSFHHPIYNLG